jgi:hypothetical protein
MKMNAGYIVFIAICLFTASYYLFPKSELAVRDDVILRQISFLVNADICIRDYKSKNGHAPKNISELLKNYPDLVHIFSDFKNKTLAVNYTLKPNNTVHINILNPRPRLNLELTEEGDIKKWAQD